MTHFATFTHIIYAFPNLLLFVFLPAKEPLFRFHIKFSIQQEG